MWSPHGLCSGHDIGCVTGDMTNVVAIMSASHYTTSVMAMTWVVWWLVWHNITSVMGTTWVVWSPHGSCRG